MPAPAKKIKSLPKNKAIASVVGPIGAPCCWGTGPKAPRASHWGMNGWRDAQVMQAGAIACGDV
jgi:hypothetical protein